jgi:hypothetical protein
MLGFNIPTNSLSVVVVDLGTDCGPKSPIKIIECEPTWRCPHIRKHGHSRSISP